MKDTRKRLLPRILSLLLALALLSAPAATALTAEQAKELLSEHYVDKIPDRVMEMDNTEDILLALGDPYTQYFTAEEYEEFTNTMQDEVVVGIGISIGIHESGLLILGVFSDSASGRAGLKAGDIVTAVDGRSAAGVDPELVASWIRGEEGTRVEVCVLHEDGTQTRYTLTRCPVVIPATVSEQIEDHICYIVCDTFGPETVAHFREAFDQFGSTSNCWVVDLRSNAGGDMSAVAEALSLFLGQRDMVYLRDGSGQYSRYITFTENRTMYPVIVLTGKWTASASEIFAGAVHAYQNGLVIGGRTFGKGVAQVVLDGDSMPDYFPDGSALKITAYRYFTPAGNTPDQVGVLPHLLVSEEQADRIALLLCADDPNRDTEGMLCVHLGKWKWHVDLSNAVKRENLPAFAELLEALPPDADIFSGVGEGLWSKTTPAEVAAMYSVDIVPRAFADTANSPYQIQIDTLRTYNILMGGGDGLFHPESGLTRAELCALLAQALDCAPAPGESKFSDVPDDAWYAPSINAAVDLGLLGGCGNSEFRPLDPVDKQQLITVMARLAARLNLEFYDLHAQGPDEQARVDEDLAGYSDWAKDAVWLLAKTQRGLFGGEINLLFAPPGELEPEEAALRGEAAALLHSVLTYTEILSY